MDETELRDRIRRWLAGTGFPLEQAAARALERVGFEVDLSRFYTSAGQQREVDIVGRLPTSIGQSIFLVTLVAECKFTSTPWVVLTRERPIAPQSVVAWMQASRIGGELLAGRLKRSSSAGNVAFPSLITMTPEPHGASIIAMPKGGKDPASVPHDAVVSVVGAARAIADESPFSAAVAWPIIILRGELYQARLSEDGDLEPEPVEWQRLVWGGVSGAPAVVDVVRERYLEPYGREAFLGLKSVEGAMVTERSYETRDTS